MQNFADFEVIEAKKDGHNVAIFLINPPDSPLVFEKPGTYSIGNNQQQRAFSQGTIYFRHGAKSECGTTDDLRKFISQRVREMQDQLVKGMRRVSEAPRGSQLHVVPRGQALWDAGLHRLAVSLDTLRPDRFLVLTRRNAHAPVLRGIEAARQAGFRALKIDAVVVRGTNEDELADLIEFGKRAGAEVRFIEYMDVGGATQWSRSKVVSRAEILDALSRRYGRIAPVVEDSSAPAERFLLADGTVFGIIASTPHRSADAATVVA
jgi:molybdenum cofactor biosynthesis enzyme MoaA